MKKESRSQMRGSAARQQTQTVATETVAATRKQSRKVIDSAPVTFGTPSKHTKSVTKGRSTALSVSSARSRDVKQPSTSDVAPLDTAVSIEQQPATVSDSAQQCVTKREQTIDKTPDRTALKTRRWVKGGPIEYSTPPSDHSSGSGSVPLHDSKRGKSSKKNIMLAFESSDKEADIKQRSKDSVPATTAGGKRKKDTGQHSLTTESKGSAVSKNVSRKSSKTSAIEPEPTRTKRMARLNAEAIVSLIYKHDEPVAKSSKFHDSSDSDVDSDSSEFSLDAEHRTAAKKSRAKMSPVQEDSEGTSMSEREHASRRPGQKLEKQSSGKSVKSRKGRPKVSSKSCKKKPIETISSSSWSPPKRMASLNAQVCINC